MQILGLIPARGGSKGIPKKNIVPVAGRPLLAYTCNAALASQKLTRVILSTDDEEVAEVGEKCGVEVPFLRPATLAEDDTPMVDVVLHTLKELEERESYHSDLVVLLQPTSPLRRVEHIDAAVETVLGTDADSVVSVVEVPHQFNPVSLMQLENGRLMPFLKHALTMRRQDKPKLYARNGPAVLAVRTGVLLEKRSLYGGDCRPLIMDAKFSVDIDTYFDLELLEFLLSKESPIAW